MFVFVAHLQERIIDYLRELLILVGVIFAVSTMPAAAQTSAEPAAGFTGIWYANFGGLDPDSEIPNKYGGGLATYPQQIAPLAIYRPEVQRTYFTFQLDPGDGQIRHALSYFDHQTGKVARPQSWLNKRTDDAHDASVLAIDDDGYLYQFSMTHGEQRRSYIRRSAEPHDITSYLGLLSQQDPDDMAVFGNPANNPGFNGKPRFSYAGAWYVPNAHTQDKFLLLHTRYLKGKERHLFSTSSSDADAWTTRRTVAQIEKGQYQTSWIKPDGRTVGTIFNVHPDRPDAVPLNHRSDLYYMQTADQARIWQAIDGATLIDNRTRSNPLTRRPDGAARVYRSAPGERVYLKDINYDADGNPVIMFLTSSDHNPGRVEGERFVRVAHWTGDGWGISTVTSTDHNYNHGSIYVESGDGGAERWRIIAPYLDGPQRYGTGGRIGIWISDDRGANWSLIGQLRDSDSNHSYVRRPLNAHEDFYALWAAGNAFSKSDVSLYFSDKAGNVYRLPPTFPEGQKMATPDFVAKIR